MRTRTWILLVVVFILLSGSAAIRILGNDPPVSEVMKAASAISEAELTKASVYAKEAYQTAIRYYDSAMLEWNCQNEKMILFRNFKKVSDLASHSLTYSEKAKIDAVKAISSTSRYLNERIGRLGEKIRDFKKYYGNFPMKGEQRAELARIELLYSESIKAFNNKNYLSCNSKLDSVEITINTLLTSFEKKLASYFEEYPKWEKWVEQAVASSKRSHSNVLVVDKYARILMVFKEGKLYKKYPVELGMNWIGDKMQQGDKATPEGVYRILEKKKSGQTRYHKAFLLDYPNEDDRNRFAMNKKTGLIRHEAEIGSLIEIHGSGGRGTDWTDGCIALTNADMDELFTFCKVGTRVTIVGSTKSLDELSLN